MCHFNIEFLIVTLAILLFETHSDEYYENFFRFVLINYHSQPTPNHFIRWAII